MSPLTERNAAAQRGYSRLLPHSVRSLGWLATWAVVTIAGLDLVGWVSGVTVLKSISPQWTAMRVITALCFLMSAGALACLQSGTPTRGRVTASRFLAAAVSGVGLLTAAGYLVELRTGQGLSWGLTPFGAPLFAPATRMAVNTALLFSLSGGVVLLLGARGRRAAQAGHVVLLPVVVVSYLALVGYVLDVRVFYQWLPPGLAPNTAIAFCALCTAALCARPGTWLVRVFSGDETGAAMARRLLPGLLVLPLLIGWLRLYGERTGLFPSEVGVALVAVTYTVCFLALVWRSAGSVNQTDRLRRTAEEAARRQAHLLDISYEAIFAWELGGPITSWNRGAQDLYGYGPEEAVGRVSHELLRTAHPDGIARVISELDEEGLWTGELVHSTKGGRTVTVESRLQLSEDALGRRIVLETNRDVTARKQAEAALRESEERYRSLFDTLLEGFCVVEMVFDAESRPVDYRFLETNPAFEEQTGLRNAQGRSMRELAPDHEAHWFEIYGRVALTGEPVRFVNEARAWHRWFDVHAYRVGGPDSRRVAILFNDITESRRAGEALEEQVRVRTAELATANESLTREVADRRRAEEELRATSIYARSLLEASLDPLVTISPEGRITDVNEATVAATGVPRTVLIGTDFSDYFTEPEQAREGYRRVFAEGFVTDYPLTVRHRSGRLTDVLYNASVYRDLHGNVLGVFAAARDVTAQRQAAQYARSLIEASLDPLVTISPEGVITDVNEATAQATGVPRAQLIGTDFSNYFTEPEKARQGYQEVFSRGFVTDYPLTIRRRGGHLTDVLYNAAVYRDVDGNVSGVFAAARDITERKRAEEEVRKLNEELEQRVADRTAELVTANREMEAFTYSVSHDLRAPLRAMDGFSLALLEDYHGSLDDQGREYLGLIRQASQTMAQLIDDLLTLSRVSRGELRRETINMSAVVSGIATRLREAEPKRRVSFVVPPGITAHGDPRLVHQVLQNLLHNAWKFTAKHPRAAIEFGTMPRDGRAAYYVRDDGAGFDPRYEHKLFGVFQRLHSMEEFEGTGIGLAIVQRIIQRHGGQVWAEGGVEKGATFSFTLE